MKIRNISPAGRLASALLLAAGTLLTACDGDHHNNYSSLTGPDAIVGSGSVSSEPRAVSGFRGVSLSGAGRLLVDRTGFESLTITAEDNILPLLTSEVVGGLLELGVATGRSIRTSREILYEVNATTFDRLRISGAGDVEAAGIQTSHFRVDISGAGNVTAFGRAEAQEIAISGAARYDAEGVTSREATVRVSGAGFARVRVSHRLDADVSGTAVIEYYGNPVVNVTGNGTVRRMGP